MTGGVLHYSVGNEHNPGNPFGRSDLRLDPDGTVRVDHVSSRSHTVGAWTGRVEATAVDALWTSLTRAGFPNTPSAALMPGATLRRLTVESDGTAQVAVLDWHKASSLPGYAEVFDALDGIIRQVSNETVPYPTSRPALVYDITAVPPEPARQ